MYAKGMTTSDIESHIKLEHHLDIHIGFSRTRFHFDIKTASAQLFDKRQRYYTEIFANLSSKKKRPVIKRLGKIRAKYGQIEYVASERIDAKLFDKEAVKSLKVKSK